MVKIRFLSYPVAVGDPGWPNNPTLSFEPFTQIGVNGEAANTYMLHLFNHFGSHMDGPNHFNPTGAKVYQLPAEKFVYTSPVLVDVSVGDDELVTWHHVQPYEAELQNADCILFRTGYARIRS
ncbi:MAG: cyclase family protein, partial [Alicyclobacillus macrosporangiidus]|uniref:cyclase family protein n=1 Tax=Alicyclobacillus macrosporangiidus TaxID=392015 RepID=UPI0026EBEFE3